MKKYTVTTTENLRSLCIKNNWFTEGTNKQYEKLFYANEHGCSIEEIATIIWLCSNSDVWCRRDILDALKIESINFWKLMFGVEDETQTFQPTKSIPLLYVGKICQLSLIVNFSLVA